MRTTRAPDREGKSGSCEGGGSGKCNGGQTVIAAQVPAERVRPGSHQNRKCVGVILQQMSKL